MPADSHRRLQSPEIYLRWLFPGIRNTSGSRESVPYDLVLQQVNSGSGKLCCGLVRASEMCLNLRRAPNGGPGITHRPDHLALPHPSYPISIVKDSQALARFQREAQAAPALRHPNICTNGWTCSNRCVHAKATSGVRLPEVSVTDGRWGCTQTSQRPIDSERSQGNILHS
jgi:hypothetical protein